jgi:hypothetical protein
LNRLELTPVRANADSRYKKIAVDRQAVQALFIDAFLQAFDTPPDRVVLDLDATDDPIHGHQSGRFFHGYYGHYCYLPLYIFCGDHLLCAKLRPSNIDASAGPPQADRLGDSPEVGAGAHCHSRRFGFLSGTHHGLVRGE